MAQQPTKAWGGRFRQATDPAVEHFTASIHFDRALARYDLRLSAAHACMLRAQGLIGAADELRILEGLEAIGAEIDTCFASERSRRGGSLISTTFNRK